MQSNGLNSIGASSTNSYGVFNTELNVPGVTTTPPAKQELDWPVTSIQFEVLGWPTDTNGGSLPDYPEMTELLKSRELKKKVLYRATPFLDLSTERTTSKADHVVMLNSALARKLEKNRQLMLYPDYQLAMLNNTCGFFKLLPREIRNIIYSHLLTSSTGVVSRVRKGDAWDCEKGWLSTPSQELQTIIGEDKTEKPYLSKPWSYIDQDIREPKVELHTNILLACETIYREATDILYDTNVFKVEPYGIERAGDALRRATRAKLDIRSRGYDRREDEYLMVFLWSMPNLKSLEIDFCISRPGPNYREVALVAAFQYIPRLTELVVHGKTRLRLCLSEDVSHRSSMYREWGEVKPGDYTQIEQEFAALLKTTENALNVAHESRPAPCPPCPFADDDKPSTLPPISMVLGLRIPPRITLQYLYDEEDYWPGNNRTDDFLPVVPPHLQKGHHAFMMTSDGEESIWTLG
ncbi:hypothetical protein BLS_002868 [Venturia inaequalis]|uniref:DUF7730 domain-containing protein n=1 Tax=Venturia inaequalis TaxID=5025 RepID=A0A8H3UPV7_VENIN|nr:hypothetical protein BLS_002868 [Venturia inaequalis]